MSVALESPQIERPEGLGRAGAELWESCIGEREFSRRELIALRSACGMVDLAEKCREAAMAESTTTESRYAGKRAHPGVSQSIRLASEARKILRSLKLA
jgi:hypothetical protein